MVENLPAIQETWVRCLSWEDPLEEGMATHFSILAWRIPIDRGAWWATDHRVTKNWTRLSNWTELNWTAFFLFQLSHPYMTTGKTIALTRWTFVGKVMSLLFNMLSRLVIAFLLRTKHLLILWLQSPSAVILEPRKIKSATVSTVSPSICHEVFGRDAKPLGCSLINLKPFFKKPLIILKICSID